MNSPYKWIFTGTFDDYEEIPMLYSFFKHIISGTIGFGTTPKRDYQIHKDASILCQHLKTKVRTDRQLRYQPRDSTQAFRSTAETPINVGMPLLFHLDCRSRDIVKNLTNIDLGISYKRLMRLEVRF